MSSPNSALSRAVTSRAHGLLRTLPLAALLIGCSGNTHKSVSEDYYRDSHQCLAQTRLDSDGAEIRVDTPRYLQCMARLGWKQQATTDPLLKALDKCRAQVPKPAAYQACLNQRNIQGNLAGTPERTP